MANQASDQEKVDEYLKVIRERILKPIESTEVRNYCTATLLILFSAIDGLGILLHPKGNATVTKRVKAFISFIGEEYSDNAEALSQLRNKLVHNAINEESYLCNVEQPDNHHLTTIGPDGCIYVNTVKFVEDFKNAFCRFEADLRDKEELLKRAADRLEWVNIEEVEYPNSPSPAPPVTFIKTKTW